MPEIHQQRTNPLSQSQNEEKSSIDNQSELLNQPNSDTNNIQSDEQNTNENIETHSENTSTEETQLSSENTQTTTTASTGDDSLLNEKPPKTSELITFWSIIITLGVLSFLFIYVWLPKLMKLDEIKKYSKAKVIETKKQLKEAMMNQPQIYIINSIPVSGTEVTDDWGVFSTKHLAMTFDYYDYVAAYDKTTKKKTHYWKYKHNKSHQCQTNTLKLFGDIEFDCSDVIFNLSTVPTESDITDENKADFNNGKFREKYIMLSPDSKYELRVLNDGEPVSFLALIGDNKISVQEVRERKEIRAGSKSGLNVNTSNIVNNIIFWGLAIGFWFFALIFIAVGVWMTILYVRSKIKA